MRENKFFMRPFEVLYEKVLFKGNMQYYSGKTDFHGVKYFSKTVPRKMDPRENNEVVNHFKACCSEVICTIFFFFIKINVGCSTDSSSADPVRLEFSRDFGATWHLLLPLCYHSSGHVSSLCSTEHHPSSTYYAGTTQGWRREVVHFGKLHLCG